ncbi:HD-GYP domain-containing protein [Desulfosporosinus sp. Sb-LF]|uniref:HD-GYP domain-containing protein n=1 Tax=Desulfosporosinus sp. Sb-LF TaxID=2560027 RepID=UPI00107F91A6|nr:HD-GYP domain-containing protein [Desulfosporosinus sp. Sb-LF]TGE33853.1 HD-GYP domain-containing protein [Desulfosporosinus sp. Sb-LF]
MKNLPKAFVRLFILMTLLALIIWLRAICQMEWSSKDIFHLLIFGLLAAASESLPVSLPRGGFVTVGFAVFLSVAILFPLGVSSSVALIGGMLVFGKEVRGEPFFKRVFNASQFVVSLGVAGVVLKTTGTGFSVEPQAIIIYLLAALAYMLTNMTVVAIALGGLQTKSPWHIWLGNIRWSIPNFVALAPLGLLMALIYNNYGSVGLFLLFIPLLISRHSFQLYMDMRENYLNTVQALVQALEAKDTYTSGHSSRVEQLAVMMAESIEMSEDKIELLKYAAVLHDVGKIGVSEIILNKEGKLLDSEWESIRSHPIIGQKIIKSIKFMFDIGNVVRHHHERYDGKGYPDGIKGEEIPLDSRIIAVADTYDAITSDRSYRKGNTYDEAIKELKRVAGAQLDPAMVEVFCKVVTKETSREMLSAERIQIA